MTGFVVTLLIVGLSILLIVIAGMNRSLGDFVQIMESAEQVKLSDEVLAVLREYAAKDLTNFSDDPAKAYREGLEHGVTLLARFVLGEEEE